MSDAADNQIRFRRLLAEQLDFLHTSASKWDEGHTNESKRIALAIRVLCYDNASTRGLPSVSLLTHLGATDIKIGRVMGDDPPTTSAAGILGSLGIGIVRQENGGTRLVPRCQHPERFALTSVTRDVWWDEIIGVHGKQEPITRKSLVQQTANKDGGAHVQSELPSDYVRIARGDFGPWLQFPCSHSGGSSLAQAQLVALRDMAYELISSPELLALVTE